MMDDAHARAIARGEVAVRVHALADQIAEQEDVVAQQIESKLAAHPTDRAMLLAMLDAARAQREYTLALYGARNTWRVALETQGGYQTEAAAEISAAIRSAAIMSSESLAQFEAFLPQ